MDRLQEDSFVMVDKIKNNSMFSHLKSCSLELLDLLQNPRKQSPALSRLLVLLRSSPSDAIQPFFDYTLFPLLLLLDAAVDSRSVPKCTSEEKSAMHSPSQTQHKMSDAVSEAVLQCLEELLTKCRLVSVNQMTVVLKTLADGAMLSPLEAAEEFREGVVRCFRTLISYANSCFDKSCSCKHSLNQPPLLDIEDLRCSSTGHFERQSEPKECLIAFLQSESASPAVGHWLSLLLNIAEAESSRGLKGSSKIRIEALLTLRMLVAKVGTPDALAFFLPGVVSQLAKVLNASKSMISGAAGSTEATDHAIRGLAEFLMIVLHDDANMSHPQASLNSLPCLLSHKNESPQSFLEELRHLHVKAQDRSESSCLNDSCQNVITGKELRENQSPSIGGGVGPLHVARTRGWLEKTSVNVGSLLSKIFPHICVHPSKRIRRGVLSAVQGLLSKCNHTLKGSRLILLECLSYLVCDDSEDVSLPAQDFLGSLFLSLGEYTVENDLAEIFNRLLEKLPKLVLGCEESLALTAAQQMLAVVYYSGPQLVVDHLLRSPMKAVKFFEVFALCLSEESVFAGSLGKLVLSRPSSTGYLHSLAELRVGSRQFLDQYPINDNTPELSNISTLVKEIHYSTGQTYENYELPHMPPWFAYVGSHKLYQALSGILRLVGLSLTSDLRNETSLSKIIEIPLDNLRKLVFKIRKEYNRESWDSWYTKTHSGQLLRHAETAARILNEMIFGISDQAINALGKKFHQSGARLEEKQKSYANAFGQPCQVQCRVADGSHWIMNGSKNKRQNVIDCVGTILHEYLTPEIWDLPVIHQMSLLQSSGMSQSNDKHFLHDVAALHQVLIEGIGIFNLTLGEHFASSGFLGSSLYMLLENLMCSNSDVRHASDAVLRLISATSGCSSVGHLVMLNSDYVIDSLCHQLRHLDLNPHVPDVLAAMLSCVGVTHKVLPLLEEPMRSVSVELEILGRHHHPELTIHFLKAVAEIAKAAKLEAHMLPAQAESFLAYVNPKVFDVKKELERDAFCPEDPEPGDTAFSHDLVTMEKWESILFKLNENRRYRQIVASIAVSCLTAVTPLLASEKEPVCLIALNIIEDGIATLEKVEKAFKSEEETKGGIEEVASLRSFHHLKDILDAAQEGTDENRLLPAMNKIWPYLVACTQNRIPVPVRRCVEVISNVVKICGGNFFSRRFHNDGSHFWKLLSNSPFKRKLISCDEKAPLLPYRSTSRTLEDPVSESSILKTQAAVLHMIAELSRDKKSASALEVVFKKVSGLVVGIACSGLTGLWDASIQALSGLASIDPDLIWLLLADVYYSQKSVQPPNSVTPELAEILPLPSSSTDYLYVLYGGQTYGFDVSFSSVGEAYKKLYPEMFGIQALH